MPIEEKHILKFLENPVNERYNSELLDLIINRINGLCFKECQVDRIACTLTPMCSRRFLLKLRIKNGLPLDDLPKFCYSVHKGVVERDFRGKTVVYKPNDSYLYLIDFLDIFFHGDYRKLNKFISFKNWDDAEEIFDNRVKKGENFRYFRTENYLVIKYEDRLHVIFLNEGYVLSNANREEIKSIELIAAIVKLYSIESFSETKINISPEKDVELKINIPSDVVLNIKKQPPEEESVSNESNDYYFWNKFGEDLLDLSEFCEKININKNWRNDLILTIHINTETHHFSDNQTKIPLRYRDLIKIIDFLTFIYNKFYVIWL